MALENVQGIPSVAAFYDDQELLITGATGFLGKSIIEKLLYSCPNIKTMYLLLRTKKGCAVEKRLEQLKKDIVFDRLKQRDPRILDKLVPVAGDVREVGLQMSAESVQRISNVSIVIHGAATVRFDEPLKESIIMNTRGTREVLLLAKGLKHLKIFAHISTAYCNPDIDCTEEKLYPIHVDWREAIKMAETLDLDTLEAIATKYTGFHPNSYTFSKKLSEHMVNDFRHELPILIHRPSIVSPTIFEPTPGWVDNFNGPVGIMLPVAIGISRVLLGRTTCHLNFVPVDYVSCSLIAAIAQTAVHLGSTTLVRIPEVPIYNYGMAKEKSVDIGDVMHFGLIYIAKYPVENMMWYPSVFTSSSVLIYKIVFALTQLLPGLFVDVLLRLAKQKLSVVRILRKIYYVQISLRFFMTKDFDFKNHNTFHSQKLLRGEDIANFKCTSYIDFNTYMGTCLLGARRHLLNQDPKTIPASLIKYRIFQVLYYAIIFAFGYYITVSFFKTPIN